MTENISESKLRATITHITVINISCRQTTAATYSIFLHHAHSYHMMARFLFW